MNSNYEGSTDLQQEYKDALETRKFLRQYGQKFVASSKMHIIRILQDVKARYPVDKKCNEISDFVVSYLRRFGIAAEKECFDCIWSDCVIPKPTLDSLNKELETRYHLHVSLFVKQTQ